MLDTAIIGIAQWLPAPGEPEENLEAALGFIDDLADAGCDLIILPELWASGYDPATVAEDARACAQPLDGPRVHSLGMAARQRSVWLAAGSVPECSKGAIFNTALMFSNDGSLCGHHRKAHLYVPGGEDRAFAPGDRLTVCETEPFGRVGLTICLDGDFPEVARSLRLQNVRIVVQPSAYSDAVVLWWDRLYPAHAMANGQWWFMANQCGSHSSASLFGGSQILSPFGDVVAHAGRAAPGTTPPPELLVAELRLRDELERADRELEVLVTARRPRLYRDR